MSSLIDIAHMVVPAFRPIGVTIDQGGIDRPKLSVGLDIYSLFPQDDSTLSFGCFQVDILRIVDDLPVDKRDSTFILGHTHIF